MIPQFKFTINYTSLDGLSTDTYAIPSHEQPRGWKASKLKLERHEKYHSLIEYFEAPLEFYGPAWGFIVEKEIQDGIRVNLTITAEIQHDRQIGYEPLFAGRLAIQAIEDRRKADRKFIAKIPIIRNDLWALFTANVDTEVNVNGTTGLRGNAVTPLTPKTLNLPSQKIRSKYEGDYSSGISFYDASLSGKYLQVDPPHEVTSEIQTKFNIGTVINPLFPVWTHAVKYAGDYTISISMEVSRWWQLKDALVFDVPDPTAPFNTEDMIFSGSDYYADLNIYINDVFHSSAGKSTQTLTSVRKSTLYTLISLFPLNLVEGDRITVTFALNHDLPTTETGLALEANEAIIIWGNDNSNVTITASGGSADGFNLWGGAGVPPSGNAQPSVYRLFANTAFPITTSEALLLHDIGFNILDRITTIDRFYSSFLGHTDYTVREYDEVGCGFPYMILLGLHARGYTFATKILSMSFSNWYESTDAILNLGLGYRTIDGTEMIVVEKKESFYDNTERSIVLLNVADVVRTYDLNSLVQSINIGYKDWEAQSEGVLDDPQASSNYSTVMELAGKPLKVESEFVAAGLVLEATRRKSVEPTKDWKYDNKAFIVTINKDSGPESFDPELDENFSDIANLLNEDTRYNLRLWPVFNLIRWMNVILIGITRYTTSVLKFNGAEGNYDAEAKMDPASDCLLINEELISSKQDIPIDISTSRNKPLHGEEIFSFECPMSWQMYKAIREKKENAIGIGTTGESTFDFTFDLTFQGEEHVEDYYIKSLEWEICKAKAKLEVWKDIPAIGA